MSQLPKTMRVQKYIAMSGIASRRQAESMIEAGLVKINGKVVTLGAQCASTDHVEVDGKVANIVEHEQRHTYILNKRLGEVCTRSDPEGRPTVFDRLPPCPNGRWVMVGRLDINTTGLLIFTNDGDYAQSLMHPRYEIERVYIAKVFGDLNKSIQHKLLTGIALDDGLANLKSIKVLKQNKQQVTVEVITTSGRNRIIRRIFKAVGCQVARLHRIRYGTYEIKKTGI